MDMSYIEELAEMAMQPETHFAFVWGMWIIGYLRYLNRRVARIERALNIVPLAPPRPIEIRRKRKNTGEGLGGAS